ncbi:MAG TPA: hypothetical protein VJX67_11700, partial [Blastocatellia bacterium]|nr:hypothetical protein [Blastocatellia bacterium]
MESTTVSEPNETTAGQGAGAVRAPAASAGAGAAVGSRTEISPPNPPLRLRIISIFVTALVIAAAIILVSRSRNIPTAETVARAGRHRAGLRRPGGRPHRSCAGQDPVPARARCRR